MICSSCRRSIVASVRSLQSTSTTATLSRSSPLSKPQFARTFGPLRTVSTVPSTPAAAASTPPPSTTTSDASQSSSNPASSKTKKSQSSEAAKPRKLKSSVPGGAELKGLGYTKAQPVIKAMEDHEYPDWLWTLLDEDGGAGKLGETKVDVSAMTKKQRARYEKAQEKIRASMPVQIPLHEQSKDITSPGDDAFVSQQRRDEIRKSKRVANRRKIRETNFLKSM